MNEITPPPRTAAWTRTVCFVLLSATFVNYAHRVVFSQNAVSVQAAFGVGDAEYGRIQGLFGLGFAFGGLTFGFIADTLPVRWLYPSVVLIWSAFGAATGVVTTLDELKAVQFLLGFFEAGHWPCALRTTQRVFRPEQRTLGNSLLQSGASLGAIATPMLVLALLRHDPEQWRLAFYVVGVLGLPWAVAWLLTVSSADLSRPVLQAADPGTGRGEDRVYADPPFYEVFLMPRWWTLLVLVISINTMWHFIRVWMPVILEKDRGYTRADIQWFTSTYYLATFFGSVASGSLTAWLCARGWNVHRTRLLAFFLFGTLCLATIPAALLPRGPAMLATLLLTAVGSLGLFPIYYSLNQEISAKHQGKVGGTLGFSAWGVLYFVQTYSGKGFEEHPELRPWLFAAVGALPLLGWCVLATCWGRRKA